MNHLNKARAAIHAAQQGSTTTNDISGMADDIADEITLELIKALEDALPDDMRKKEAEKRKAVAEKYGQIVADALAGKALNELYQRVTGNKPDDDPATNASYVGAPDPKEYFGTRKWSDDDRAPDPEKYFK